MYKKEAPLPSIYVSLIPLVITGLALWVSVFVLDTQPHFALFLGATTAGICAYASGCSWEIIREGFKGAISRTIPALLILLIIGMLIGVWISSGIVPALMYFGFKVLTARWFLPLIFLFCGLMSLITGSSWTTIGTIGVAAVGVGEGLGIPVAMTAGAIVSGAFFGDKISPMSDSTNLTSSVLGVNLFDHIRHMLYTTVPAMVLSLIAFTILGFTVSEGGAMGEVATYTESIQEHFHFTFWLFIPPLAVIALIFLKVPAIPCLITGLILGGVATLLFQGGSLEQLFETIHSGYVSNTGSEEIDTLFSRGGMESMYNVVILALISLALGGIMDRTGMLHSIVLKLSRFVDTVGNLTVTVIFTSILINIFSANQYLAVILPGQMYEENYRKQKLKLKNLTRTLEAGGTLTAPLIPWNSSAVFVYSALGVSAGAYAPYAVFCWLSPLVAVLFAYTNLFMERVAPRESEPEDQQ
nr:Na+/H+ antiporter NhaC [uncultured Sphaerochaeta sp.]